MSITSYAQNFEDVMLWRALGHVEHGSYIDVGAHHPIADSVSKAFYENGWRGVHVEPMAFYADLLRTDRPDELVVQAAIAAESGLLTFYEIPTTGLSTASTQIAEYHRKTGYEIRETTVLALTLDDLFARVEAEVNWLKIDVEGFEKEVIAGWRYSSHRPWIVVVESTFPSSQWETHQDWEPLILRMDYAFGYFDGLNRFYVSKAHPELLGAFRFGPNIFDGFQLSEASWPVVNLKKRFHKLIEDEVQQKVRIENQLVATREAHEEELQQKVRIENQLAVTREAQRRDAGEWARQEQTIRRKASRAIKLTRRKAAAQLRELNKRVVALTEQSAQAQNGLFTHAEENRHLRAKLEERSEVLSHSLQNAADRERQIRDRHEQTMHRMRLEAGLREEALSKKITELSSDFRTSEGRLSAAREALRDVEVRLEAAVSQHGQQVQAAFLVENDLRARLIEEERKVALMAGNMEQLRSTLYWRLTSPLRWLLKRDSAQFAVTPPSPELDVHVANAPPGGFSIRGTAEAVRTRVAAQSHPDMPPTAAKAALSEVGTEKRTRPGGETMQVQHVDQLLELDDEQFVEAVYAVVLGRTPDPEGFRHYVGRLRAGDGKTLILEQIYESDEACMKHPQLPGLDELIEEKRRKSRAQLFVRSTRRPAFERQLNRMENQLGRLMHRSEDQELRTSQQLSVQSAVAALCSEVQTRSAGIDGDHCEQLLQSSATETHDSPKGLSRRARLILARITRPVHASTEMTDN